MPLVKETEPLQKGLDVFLEKMASDSNAMMASKLGFSAYVAETDDPIKQELFEILTLVETDMTIFYRKLADVSVGLGASEGQDPLVAPLVDAFYSPDQVVGEIKTRYANWVRSYLGRVASEGTEDVIRRERMNRVNPKYVLRNYLAQLAIDKSEAGDHSLVNELLEILRHPYDEQPEKEEFAQKRPEWARHRAGCSMLSCSS